MNLSQKILFRRNGHFRYHINKIMLQTAVCAEYRFIHHDVSKQNFSTSDSPLKKLIIKLSKFKWAVIDFFRGFASKRLQKKQYSAHIVIYNITLFTSNEICNFMCQLCNTFLLPAYENSQSLLRKNSETFKKQGSKEPFTFPYRFCVLSSIYLLPKEAL